jgi:hypothetical protein
MGALLKEMRQPFRRLRDRVRPRDADDIEAMGARRLYQRRLEAPTLPSPSIGAFTRVRSPSKTGVNAL